MKIQKQIFLISLITIICLFSTIPMVLGAWWNDSCLYKREVSFTGCSGYPCVAKLNLTLFSNMNESLIGVHFLNFQENEELNASVLWKSGTNFNISVRVPSSMSKFYIYYACSFDVDNSSVLNWNGTFILANETHNVTLDSNFENSANRRDGWQITPKKPIWITRVYHNQDEKSDISIISNYDGSVDYSTAYYLYDVPYSQHTFEAEQNVDYFITQTNTSGNWKEYYTSGSCPVPKISTNFNWTHAVSSNSVNDNNCFGITSIDTIERYIGSYNISSEYSLIFNGSITSCTELQNAKNDLTQNYTLVNNIDCSDTINWNAGAGFVPIGNSSNMFVGNFDGKGYNITNLFMRRNLTTSWQGLFGKVNNATIKNVNLIDMNISGQNRMGVIGETGTGSVYVVNVSSSGYIEGRGFLGGLVGSATGYINIKNSYTDVIIKKIYPSGASNFGGILGYSSSSGSFVIENSFALGDIIAPVGLAVGGLVGSASNGLILNCYATGNIFNASAGNGGGFAGQSISTYINNSYSIGSAEYGFIGFASVGANCTNSYWDTEASGTSSGSGTNNCSGLIGKTTREMVNQANFTGWDFVDIWGIVDGVTYPYLLFHSIPLTPDLTSPNLIINFPLNTTYNYLVDEINFTATDETALDSCWYSTDNGATNTTATCNALITSLVTADNSSYTWFVWANDTNGNENFSSVTFQIDLPAIYIVYPEALTYNNHVTEIEYLYKDNPDTCWYSLDNGVTNTTITCGQNVTSITSTEGSNTWYLWANNSIGEIFEDSVTFNVEFPQQNPLEQNVIYTTMRGAGAGLGKFILFIGEAIPPLMFGLALVGIVIIVGYGIAKIFKINLKGGKR